MPKFNEVGSPPVGCDAYLGPNNMQEGQFVEGVIVDRWQNTSGKYPQMVYKVFTTAHQFVGINSCGQLDFKMEKVADGAYVLVTYLGKITLTSGQNAGKDSHQFKVEVADEDADTEAHRREAYARLNTTQTQQQDAFSDLPV